MPRLPGSARDRARRQGAQGRHHQGAGTVYSSGLDLTFLREVSNGPLLDWDRPNLTIQIAEALRAFPRILVAQVHGYCLGGALGIMNCHDLVYAAEDAQPGGVEGDDGAGELGLELGDDVFALLREHQAGMCLAGAENDLDVPFVSTADWGYLRLRRADYDDATLTALANRLRAQTWRDTFVFFKHEDAGTGPRFAKRLLELLTDTSAPQKPAA